MSKSTKQSILGSMQQVIDRFVAIRNDETTMASTLLQLLDEAEIISENQVERTCTDERTEEIKQMINLDIAELDKYEESQLKQIKQLKRQLKIALKKEWLLAKDPNSKVRQISEEEAWIIERKRLKLAFFKIFTKMDINPYQSEDEIKGYIVSSDNTDLTKVDIKLADGNGREKAAKAWEIITEGNDNLDKWHSLFFDKIAESK